MKKGFTFEERKTRRGFTLIELLVVISIIGILAGMTMVSYTTAQRQARDTERRSDLAQYRNGLANFAVGNDGLFPVRTTLYNASSFCGAELAEFISACPADPIGTDDYLYLSDADGTEYILYADLETTGWWYVCSSGISAESASQPNLGTCP